MLPAKGKILKQNAFTDYSTYLDFLIKWYKVVIYL